MLKIIKEIKMFLRINTKLMLNLCIIDSNYLNKFIQTHLHYVFLNLFHDTI
jgi:hypothetical protein